MGRIKRHDIEFRGMRNKEQLIRRDRDIEHYFNEKYKEISVGSQSAKYNIAVAKTAQKFYLTERTINYILTKSSNL